MKELCNYSNTNTYKYFIEGLLKGNIEFWTVENTKNNNLIGELYIFWNSTDLDEADGFNRAYLCAFRINQKFRGLGLGSKLMEMFYKE